MSKKKKSSSRAKSRRASLKSYAKGKFQSPVHSNGFKQDILIDMYGGDVGFRRGDIKSPPLMQVAIDAGKAGKESFRYDGRTYKVIESLGKKGKTYTAGLGKKAGKVG